MMWECEHKIVSRLMSICMCNALVKGAKHTHTTKVLSPGLGVLVVWSTK